MQDPTRGVPRADNLQAAFLADIIARPDDDAVRLIYADWLTEQDEPALRERAEFIRVQCALQRTLPERVVQQTSMLQERVQALLGNSRSWPDAMSRLVGEAPEMLGFGWDWQRGFLWRVRCPLGAWYAHGPRLCRHHPLLLVAITDREPLLFQDLASGDFGACWAKDPRGSAATAAEALAEELPAALFDRLRGYEPGGLLRIGPGQPVRQFHSPAGAKAALSGACLHWARTPSSGAPTAWA